MEILWQLGSVMDARKAMFAGNRNFGRGPGPGRHRLLLILFLLIELTLISHTSSEIHSEDNPEDTLVFTSEIYNATVQENSVGKVYIVASEKMGIFCDDPSYKIRYKIVSGDNENFFKAEAEKVGNFVFLMIRTRTSNVNVLNRERIDRYKLTVRAVFRDSDQHRLNDMKATTIVNVKVLDSNDLDPFFNPSTYSVTVPEDTPLHSSVAQVKAEDADEGINGEIYYSLAEETDQFAIHPVSGVISLTRPLQFSEKKIHRLRVNAQDRGVAYSYGPKRMDTASVTIMVSQVNLHDPEMRIQRLPEVIEQSHADIYAIIHISDDDEGRHGEVSSVEIIEGDPDAHFRIRKGSSQFEYNIEVLKLLDREISPNGYNLTLKATDNGLPARSSYTEVHVRLGDMNDHSPVFDKEEYHVKVPESALVNTPITKLKVTDQDQGRNAKVLLKIVAGNRDEQFRIDPVSGMLYVAKPLDAEYKTRYTLTVSAVDQANIGSRRQSSARVRISVLDVNDNDPKFDETEKTIYFDENEPAGSRVLRVIAKDQDSGENAHISYSIANVNAEDIPFDIDHLTGVIKSRRLIDYETDKREYKLQIRASDWGTPFRRQSEMRLTIRIKDINDNRPQFEREACVGKVSRSMPVGGEIITLSALDFDAGKVLSARFFGL